MYIQEATYTVSIDNEKAIRLGELVKHCMFFCDNIERIVGLINKCNLHCRLYDLRKSPINRFLEAFDQIREVIDFFIEINDKTNGSLLTIKIDEELLQKPSSLTISIISVIHDAREIHKLLYSCRYIEDKNCQTSRDKEEIQLFFDTTAMNFEDVKGVPSLIFGG